MEKLVSVIVVNWNGVGFLKDCFNSISAQTYENLEVIMVDCASSDESVPFVKENFPQVRVIELKEDPGPPSAINLAARDSEGDYLLILNNDVRLPEDLIKRTAEELQRGENCVVTPVELNWEGEYLHSGIPEYWIGRYLAKFVKLRGRSPFYPSTACCLTTREILLSLPLNEDLFMYEDTEWGWRLHLNRVRIKALPEAFFFHKGAGTKLDCSPRQAFFVGRVVFATCFVCFRFLTFLVVLPILCLSHLRNGFRFLRRKRLASLYSYLGGIIDFFRHPAVWMRARSEVQAQRQLGDWEILKLMAGSIDFEKHARREWMEREHRAQMHERRPARERMLV
jgi:GT2 family glycosyltransferase